MAKRNKMLRKVLVTMCSAVLLVGATVGVTVAYLTSTDEVNNTFTVGNVVITLDEAKVDENGVALKPEVRVEKNSYKLYPGHTYDKDPTVTVKAGSDESFVRVLVTVNNRKDLDTIFAANEYDIADVIGGYDSTKWVDNGNVVDENNDTRTYEFRYYQTVTALGDTDVVLEDVFKTITVPGDMTKEQLATISDLKIDVVAQAIQADGFNNDADAAWAQWK